VPLVSAATAAARPMARSQERGRTRPAPEGNFNGATSKLDGATRFEHLFFFQLASV